MTAQLFGPRVHIQPDGDACETGIRSAEGPTTALSSLRGGIWRPPGIGHIGYCLVHLVNLMHPDRRNEQVKLEDSRASGGSCRWS